MNDTEEMWKALRAFLDNAADSDLEEELLKGNRPFYQTINVDVLPRVFGVKWQPVSSVISLNTPYLPSSRVWAYNPETRITCNPQERGEAAYEIVDEAELAA